MRTFLENLAVVHQPVRQWEFHYFIYYLMIEGKNINIDVNSLIRSVEKRLLTIRVIPLQIRNPYFTGFYQVRQNINVYLEKMLLHYRNVIWSN
jgi:hypothetical protein